MSTQDFSRKRITQTEYRGGKFKRSSQEKSQYLSTDLNPIVADAITKEKFKKNLFNKMDHFLGCIVSEEAKGRVYKSPFFLRILKKLGL